MAGACRPRTTSCPWTWAAPRPLAIAAPDGTVLHRDAILTLADQGADQVMRRVVEHGRALTARTAADRHGALRAVAAASPGIVLEDRILPAPNDPGCTASTRTVSR
ncbi:hypothetical protein [Streptomyces sp. NRRL S-813]|uniref:hypothetical protein n=1 Tax=Streptomyces sp. NRRL S-813 TaxID=1463919 RepID=UPI0004BF8892|nr:hypothetical protein [Streptomyces sp. NRRL S-813]